MLPLEGFRVVDLSRNIAGPLATMLLGDLGADVVKVERPDGGAEARNHADDDGVSPYFAALNRNKRSVCLDLKTAEGTDALAALLGRADVLVENFRPGALDRLGFDDARLERDFPQLVVCHISGFGRTGPWAQAAAYDHIIQGFAGLMSLTGPAGTGGYRTNTSVADIVTGLFAATTVAATLCGRERGSAPGGDIVHVSLLAGLLNALGYQAATYLTTGRAPAPTGNEHPYIQQRCNG
jgi:CoA:oxalate CoA-transferase